MLYKIAVCDDEQVFVDEITHMLEDRSDKFQISSFNSGEELLETALDFNILFLDIEMPGLSGMETAHKLREAGFDGMIIFLTSHTEFMPDAFKIKAFRFLDKPIDSEKFDEALTEAEKDILNEQHIIIIEKKASYYLKLSDIVFLEAYGDGTYIYDKNGRVHNTDKPLKYWKGMIGTEHFYQIHKSMIVSLMYIEDFSNDGTLTVRHYSKKLSLSRRNAVGFKSAFFEYIKKYARIM
ncbi:MAG: LytTR family DNA-binding domain-containing protein [Oscillospiraceae bacterium]|nr:LytTR family DNA-binding domain-containing protein [Oscillospiraceae bacterium]